MLDWFPNADHVGIYQALAEGDFTQAGSRRARRRSRRTRPTPLKLLAAGKVDARDLLRARGAARPQPGTAAGVGGGDRPAAADLDRLARLQAHQDRRPVARQARRRPPGSRTSTPTCRRSWRMPALPASSVKEINVGTNLVPAMLSGSVDATLGAYWNYEAIQLAQLRKHPNVIHMQDVGVPTYDELVVVVRKNTLVNHPDVIRRFVQALARGLRVGPAGSPGGGHEPGAREPGARSEAAARERPRDPARLLPDATRPAVGLAGPRAVERLRRVDARPTT